MIRLETAAPRARIDAPPRRPGGSRSEASDPRTRCPPTPRPPPPAPPRGAARRALLHARAFSVRAQSRRAHQQRLIIKTTRRAAHARLRVARHTMPPTRAELLSALDAATPAGGERACLSSNEALLRGSRARLDALRARRAMLARLVSVRARKRRDWKSKIPRGGVGVPDVRHARGCLSRAGPAPCVTLCLPTSLPAGVALRPCLRPTLAGLAGFSHVWVIVRERDARLALHLARLCQVRGHSLVLCPPPPPGAVLDLKPYLAYCDAPLTRRGTAAPPRSCSTASAEAPARHGTRARDAPRTPRITPPSAAARGPARFDARSPPPTAGS